MFSFTLLFTCRNNYWCLTIFIWNVEGWIVDNVHMYILMWMYVRFYNVQHTKSECLWSSSETLRRIFCGYMRKWESCIKKSTEKHIFLGNINDASAGHTFVCVTAARRFIGHGSLAIVTIFVDEGFVESYSPIQILVSFCSMYTLQRDCKIISRTVAEGWVIISGNICLFMSENCYNRVGLGWPTTLFRHY